MKLSFSNRKHIGLLLILMAFSFAIVNFIGPSETRKVIIDGDGSGLYAYLPAIFVFHSVDFTTVLEFEKNRRPPDYQGHYFHEVNGILINKFTSGQALLQLPFFLIAYLLSFLTGFETDGYNIFFQYAVAFAALFWTSVALYYFVKLATTYKISKESAWLMAFIGFFGSNLFFYTVVAPSHSHAYSFSIVTITFYFVRKSFLMQNRNTILMAAFWFGMVVLVRPVNLIAAAAFPFLASSLSQFRATIKFKLFNFHFLAATLVFLLALSPQFIINFLQTGKPIIYGYQNEGFYFSNPEIFNFLFSFRKGWLVYTPLMLLLIPAMAYLFKRSKYEFYTFLAFFVLLVYVFSSWWNWFYGDSFGMRPMVDFYGLFFLVILLMISSIKKKMPLILTGLFILVAIFLNLFQTWQYAAGIIHPDAMNKQAYNYVFLRSDKSLKHIVSATDESFYGVLQTTPFFETNTNLEGNLNGWKTNLLVETENESTAAKLTETMHYGPSFEYQIPDSFKENVYIYFESKFFEPQINAAINALFVVDMKDTSDRTVFYKTFKLKRLPDEITNQWKNGSIGFKIPDFTANLGCIKFYIWNKDKQAFLLDDLRLQFYTYEH